MCAMSGNLRSRVTRIRFHSHSPLIRDSSRIGELNPNVAKNREVMKSKAQTENRLGSVVIYVTERLDDVAALGSGLERSYSRLSVLAFE